MAWIETMSRESVDQSRVSDAIECTRSQAYEQERISREHRDAITTVRLQMACAMVDPWLL